MVLMGLLRAEESPFAREDCDEDVVSLRHFTHELRQAEVEVLGHGIEFLLVAESDDGDFAADLKGHCGFWVHAGHDGCWVR